MDATTTSRAQTLKALLRPRRVANAWPSPEHGVVMGRYLQGREQASQMRMEAPPTAAPPAPHFVDGGGLVIEEISLWLIYWGTAWAADISPTASEITEAVKTMLAGTYFSALSQYRGASTPVFKGAIEVIDSDPPNPFSDAAVASMIHQQLELGRVPEPDDDPSILYCVVLPPAINPSDSSMVGEHSYFVYFDLTDLELPPDFDIARAHYAWIANDGTIDSVTTVLSHELVESATDPNGDAWQGAPGTCNQSGWCEIGDVCSWSETRAGVRVQAYWSEVDQACIVPGATDNAPPPAALSPDGSVGAAGKMPALGHAQGITSSAPSQSPLSSLTARYAGGLLEIAWLVPIVASIIGFAAYVYPNIFPPQLGLLSESPVFGGVVAGLLFWVVLAAVYAPTADARHANGSSYAELAERLSALNARLTGVPPENQNSAYAEAISHRDFVAAELVSTGPRWVAAVGYVTLWQRIHRAEEALVSIEPRNQVVADALYDEWRLKDSTVDHAPDLLAELESARQYLVNLRVADGAGSQAIHSETEARAVVSKVRYAIDDFRDKRRSALVRARNLLIATMVITELFAAGLLALAMIAGAPARVVVAAIVYYLVGALVGLFNRLAQQVGAGTLVEDYSLAGVRLVLTPTISGLAAIGGVALTGMLAMSGLTGFFQATASSSAPPASVPLLADIFDLNRFRIGLLVAALFGASPAILSNRLQRLTEEYQNDLKSTDPSSSAPTKRP